MSLLETLNDDIADILGSDNEETSRYQSIDLTSVVYAISWHSGQRKIQKTRIPSLKRNHYQEITNQNQRQSGDTRQC